MENSKHNQTLSTTEIGRFTVHSICVRIIGQRVNKYHISSFRMLSRVIAQKKSLRFVILHFASDKETPVSHMCHSISTQYQKNLKLSI